MGLGWLKKKKDRKNEMNRSRGNSPRHFHHHLHQTLKTLNRIMVVMIRRYYNISPIFFLVVLLDKKKYINKEKGGKESKKNQSWKTMCHVKIMLLNK